MTPDHVYSYLALKVFGITSQSATDKSTQGRTSTIESWKKVILYFLPNKLMKWNLQSNSWNPVRTVIINKLIKRVKKHKVRREGKASSARRAMEICEFLEVVKRRQRLPESHLWRFTGVACFLFQFHMISRLDNVEHFKCEDLIANMEYPYTPKSKMRWNKNVLGERENLDQIIIGPMDSNFCIILALALHLEHSVILNNQDSNPMLFSISKGRIRALFEEITAQQNFRLYQYSTP